jgi:hypothetical protein
VAVELARVDNQVPGPHALPGNCLYELIDAFRVAIAIGNGHTRLGRRTVQTSPTGSLKSQLPQPLSYPVAPSWMVKQ